MSLCVLIFNVELNIRVYIDILYLFLIGCYRDLKDFEMWGKGIFIYLVIGGKN